MNAIEVTPLEVYHIIRVWASQRLHAFPYWDFDDICNEAYLIAIKKLDTYDPSRGTLANFLWGRLYEPLFRRYAQLNGLRIERTYTTEKGKRKYGTRQIFRWEYQTQSLPNTPYRKKDDYLDWDTSKLSKTSLSIYSLLGRGHSQAECARLLNISESAVSQQIRVMRGVLKKQ